MTAEQFAVWGCGAVLFALALGIIVAIIAFIWEEFF